MRDLARTNRLLFKWKPSRKGLMLHVVGQSRALATVVPDDKYLGMYRVELPDGTLSDMVNLSRAKDAAIALARKAPETSAEGATAS